MKKVLLFFIAAFVVSGSLVFGQMTTDRKYKSIQHAEHQVFELGFDMDTMKNHIYPMLMDNRDNLAPHYPDFQNIERSMEARKLAMLAWIEQYPAEYDDYYNYLRIFVTSNQ